MKIFEFFAKRHILATLFTITIFILGLNSARTLKRDQFPDVDFGEVIITTLYPGASPEDVELNVTNKLEDELIKVTGIERMTSTSVENVSIIDIVIDPDIPDQEKVKDDIRNAVDRVTEFPEEVTESSLITEINTAIFEIIEVGITGEIPYTELREIAKQFEKKLKNVPGVSNLEKFGYRAREVKIEVNPGAMDSYQIPLREIIGAIQARNIRLTGGTFESYTSEKNVVTLAQFSEPQEVGDVIVRTTFEGPLIRVRDLAIVREDFEDETVISRMEGISAISFIINKDENADMIQTVKAIKKLVREESGQGILAGYVDLSSDITRVDESPLMRIFGRIKGSLLGETTEEGIFRYGPVQIRYSGDQSQYVQSSFQIVLNNGLIGLVFVVIVLTIFLNIRTAFWVAMGIPVSLLGAMFLLPFFNAFLDSIVLSSMVLVIGIIVDDGIIISESISYRRSIGDPPLQAAVNGTREVFLPVLTTVLTTFLAFAPMFFMKGLMGKFVYVIPLTVSLALFISISESVLALPAHLKRGMEKKSKTAQRESVRQWFTVLRSFYRKTLLIFLKLRYPVVILFIGIFLAALSYARNNMDFILFPSKGAERFFIGLELPVGSSLQSTSEKVKEVELIIQELPEGEIESFSTRVGTLGWVWTGEGENYALINVDLIPFSRRFRSADEITEEIRSKSEEIEGIEKIFFYIDAGGPPIGKPVVLRVVGSDDAMRKELTDRIVEILDQIAGVTDIDRDDKLGKEQIEIKIDYAKLARRGLTVADIAQNVRIAYDGQVVTSIRDGDEDVEFRVQLAEYARKNVAYLQNLRIPNQQGRLIRLGEVARLETGPGPDAYYHFDSERSTTVEADVDTDVTTSLEVMSSVLSKIDLQEEWPGMRLIVGGEAEESMESIYSLLTTFVIAFIGIYFLLILLFNSFTQPFLVMVAVPFGLVGVILALALHGEPLSFLSMIGSIGLAGVVVNDSLVLVSHINDLRKKKPDVPILNILAEGTANRLRAIILTTLTTVAGLLPLAYGLGGTHLYMSPMALVLGYGLLFATPLTLVLIPCLFAIGHDIGRIFKSS
jgi:multidrug efflux pump subunit AcrB